MGPTARKLADQPSPQSQPTGDQTFSPGPWGYIASTEHHGPYVVSEWGGDICDCYTMSNPSALSIRNGGDSRPIHFQHERADANAKLIAAAPDMYEALKAMTSADSSFAEAFNMAREAIAKAEGRA